MATIVIAVFILIISGLFFGIQSMPQLYKLNATGRKFFWRILIFFLVAPCVILLFYYIIRQYEFNIWLAGPALFLFLVWLFTGFFAKVTYKTLTEKNPRRKRVTFTEDDIKKRYRNACLLLAAAIAIWCFGFFHGFGAYDSALVILFIYFIIQGIAFILGNRKAIADGNIKDPEPKTQAESKQAAEPANEKTEPVNQEAEPANEKTEPANAENAETAANEADEQN